MNKAIFLDKDGTLIQDVAYNVDPDRIRLLPGVGNALRRLQEADFLLIVVSNQPGIALGYFTVAQLNRAVIRLYELLAGEGAYPAAFYYCPHAPVEKGPLFPYPCHCRKPRPGLLHKATDDFDISLCRSWMIGDILHDVEAGKRAGCRTILLDNGNETEWLLNEYREPDYILANIEEAAQTILEKEKDVISFL
jgi:histidinol-phosphate phosphatase family protein